MKPAFYGDRNFQARLAMASAGQSLATRRDHLAVTTETLFCILFEKDEARTEQSCEGNGYLTRKIRDPTHGAAFYVLEKSRVWVCMWSRSRREIIIPSAVLFSAHF